MSAKYKKGPPPSVGWWPTEHGWLRWWDGTTWSYGAKEGSSEAMVEYSAKRKVVPSVAPYLKWTDRPKSWPSRSFT